MFKKIIIGLIIVIILSFAGCKYLMPNIGAAVGDKMAAACEQNNVEQCNAIATLYTVGIGVEQDLQKVAYYSEKSCTLNDIDGCTIFSNALLYAGKTQQAFQTLLKICQMPMPTKESMVAEELAIIKQKICTPEIMQKLQLTDEKSLSENKTLIINMLFKE